MLEKILVPILFTGAQFIIVWYGDFTGKLADKGTYLGIHYDSTFVRSLITQFEYLWVLIIINILFSLGFNMGYSGYKNFLVIAMIWMASAPIAALLYNTIILKEKISWVIIVGVLLVAMGAIAIVANKEITKLIAGN
jgi:drug/metabolite transporter (DMT)-like permease